MIRTMVLLLVFACSGAFAQIDFELPALDGEHVQLSDFRGQWVVVNFWATWCRPCREEIPELSALHTARDDLAVLGLAYENVDVDAFEKFLQDYPASYPILVVDMDSPPAGLGAPRVLPTTHLIDPNGELAETWLGPITAAMIEKRIDE
ncbi:MAG TPA: TlpA disulfide reductase family protein [Wenzhouxiangella sp.]|nr:TlpA disulfide reductase family protein [Wenzhouxiangella sp.]